MKGTVGVWNQSPFQRGWTDDRVSQAKQNEIKANGERFPGMECPSLSGVRRVPHYSIHSQN